MAAIRGMPEDYDRWAKELGCPGWDSAAMLAAFLAVEDDHDYGGDGQHGKGGPLPLTRVPPELSSPIDTALRSAITELGYPVCDSYHAAGATGLSRVAFNISDGRRVSTNDAYLEPARSRPNLQIRGDVLVDRVALDGNRAVGVITADGEEIRARETIIAAGAIHSPAILLRSGIGTDGRLPVGANLIDHPTINLPLRLDPQARATSSELRIVQSMLRYSSGLADAGTNDMQLVWMSPIGVDDASQLGALLIGAAMQVFSRGEVRLQSLDPRIDPIVEFRMLSDERDLIRMRDALRRAWSVIGHSAVTAVAESMFSSTGSPDALPTDDAIDAWLMQNVHDYVHAAGTCRMGSVGDPAAVVDTQCRVIGFDALRVCDASVIPDIPRANTHLTTVAIAERVAALF
jgi:choline dehydrogenase-like flavoprotein